ncbi:hypothetical protein EEB18_000425 [Sphingopyxis sp. OPL5]|uniref:hypothetical protein n=1 Tax=Sphingopyxis sp. OPL5 TaxID=2486273 RepID=UPI00164E45F5|nr:hypothetical protein [Sphingopyxis sp. OPL5]QNO27506.1 hypothetical protein EEB18_000425 [Sphingopyxis sp. OPL5]
MNLKDYKPDDLVEARLAGVWRSAVVVKPWSELMQYVGVKRVDAPGEYPVTNSADIHLSAALMVSNADFPVGSAIRVRRLGTDAYWPGEIARILPDERYTVRLRGLSGQTIVVASPMIEADISIDNDT